MTATDPAPLPCPLTTPHESHAWTRIKGYGFPMVGSCPGVSDQEDPVNHPSHYTAYNGIEVIQLTEQMNFNRGNAVKYIARAGLKAPETEQQDLEKARWYIDRELARIKETP